MSIEKIIKDVEHIKDCCDQNGPWAKTLGEAIALLRTHQDAQPNEPLTLEELKEMAHQPVWMECQYFIGWAILHIAWPEIYVAAADGNTYFIWTNGEYNERLGAKLYRRPPKEDRNDR